MVRDGRMVLQLPNDVLFDTGRTELKPAGEKTLAAISGVLASMPNRHFQVAGHTDDVPIHNERFPSNWELSSGRALRVVHFLVGKGTPPAMLSAAGYGEMDPVAEHVRRHAQAQPAHRDHVDAQHRRDRPRPVSDLM
jgi:chemotaxis protein MotB